MRKEHPFTCHFVQHTFMTMHFTSRLNEYLADMHIHVIFPIDAHNEIKHSNSFPSEVFSHNFSNLKIRRLHTGS